MEIEVVKRDVNRASDQKSEKGKEFLNFLSAFVKFSKKRQKLALGPRLISSSLEI